VKVLVVYDSTYGNTEKIAKAMGGAITGNVTTLRINEVNLAELNLFDLLVIGSPTQGGRATESMQDFISKLPDSAIKGKNVAVFDTRMTTKFVKIFGYAAGKIADSLKKKGGNLIMLPEAFYVTGSKGPLKEGELERAASWAKELIKSKK
jgi:flavodoxin I